MSKPLRVLMVEDSEDDALLTIRELTKGGYELEFERVETAEAMRSALRTKTWDIILCDYNLPGFSGLKAITLLKEGDIDLPLIILSGAIGEETAVEAMTRGAHDYVMKSNLSRLVPAIKRELKEAESRSNRKLAEEALRESEKKYRWLVDNMADVITVIDMNLRFTYVSPSIMRMRGYTAEEATAQTFEQAMTPESLQIIVQVFEEEMKLEASGTADPGRSRILETDQYRKDGSIVCMENHLSFLRDEAQKPVGIISLTHDITERKQVEEALKESENKYRVIADNMTDVITIMDMNLRFTYVSPSIMRMRGYTAEEATAQTFEQAMTPESLLLAYNIYEEEMQREASGTADPDRVRIIQLEEYRKDMSTVWVEVSLSFLRDADGRPIGILSLTRDITERKKAEEDQKKTLESLRKAFGATIQVMVSAVESRDPYTAGHQIRSANLARCIATEMDLPCEKIEGLRMAGSIHDIGKLSIPAEILSKPTKLTNIEFSLIKEHSRKGYEMLKDVESPWPLAEIVYQHHERMNGSGYPRNLKGDDILIEARIMAVADVVEAMASHRPYRPGLGIDPALEEIEKNRGTHYDNTVVDACLRLFREKGFQLEGT
jgi:PAS domain S-box-containing protein